LSAQFALRIGAMLFFNAVIARSFTTAADQTATTAMGLVFRIDTMVLFVAMGWGAAAQTFVAQNVGAKNARRAVLSGVWAVGYDMVSNIAFWALLVVYGSTVLTAFDAASAPRAIAGDYLRIVAPSYVALGAGIVFGNAMSGAGATRMTLLIDTVVIVGFEVPVCLATAYFGGAITTMFACVAATNLVSALAYGVVYARRRWVRINPTDALSQ
jgi:Na+-driven multidrug efflux pump